MSKEMKSNHKKEFEELFKKSTEKLMYEIPTKNRDAATSS
jgi:hypothetical protein